MKSASATLGDPSCDKDRFSDETFLQSWRRDPNPKNFEAILNTYGPLVYSSALRQTSRPTDAIEVTRAVFLTLANRARKLSKKTVLADWLFQTTALAVRKQNPQPRFRRMLRWLRFELKRKWTLDQAVLALRKKQRKAVLLHSFLNRGTGFSPKSLQRGLLKLQRRRVAIEPLWGMPGGLAEEIIAAIPTNSRRKPTHPLTCRTVRSIRWRIRRRRFYITFATWHIALALTIATFLAIDSKSGFTRLYSLWIVCAVRFYTFVMTQPVQPWRPPVALSASDIRSASDLYKTTNIWQAHLTFTREQWQAFQPRRIEPLPHIWLPNGLILLRNPAAPRSGFAGVLGFAYDWVHADFELGGLKFQNAAVRVKGNVAAVPSEKRPFKIDLNKFAKGQSLAGLDEIAFNNLLWDHSYLADTLGYQFFREAAVPAPRTAFAWVSSTVENQWADRQLGLYMMLEPVDANFAAERFGSRHTPIFKPVTYEFLKYLGPDWSAYADIYDLKTKATPDQRQRLIDFARLITSANEPDFAAQLPNFLDLDEFARFLACTVLISTYDGILSDGQNFYLYLDPRSNKFGFIPWDLDSAWGDFWIGEHSELERASVWHPWAGENHFLERVMSLEEFRILYRARIEELLTRLLVRDRFQKRLNEFAPILRAPIAAESKYRLNRFEQFIGAKPVLPRKGALMEAFDRPVNPLLDFIEARARSVRQQLGGKTKGILIKTPSDR